MKTQCEIREGIGLCDSCLLPKWPQEYVGNGDMVCMDCLGEFYGKAVKTIKRKLKGKSTVKTQSHRKQEIKPCPFCCAVGKYSWRAKEILINHDSDCYLRHVKRIVYLELWNNRKTT